MTTGTKDLLALRLILNLSTDVLGDLFVPNAGGGGPSKGHHGSVVIFDPTPHNKFLRMVYKGVYDPWTLALGP
jgi:hypothetical protein